MIGLILAVAVILAGCHPSQAQSSEGRVVLAPHSPTSRIATGRSSLGLAVAGDATGRDGFLFVPHDTTDRHGVPLLILLHGATQRAALFERVIPAADSAGVAILAPDSREMTWDAIQEGFGADVAFCNAQYQSPSTEHGSTAAEWWSAGSLMGRRTRSHWAFAMHARFMGWSRFPPAS
jgi:hypothetical protein